MTDNQNNPPPQNNVQYVAISPHMLQAPNIPDDEIDLRELWNAIWRGKWIIIAVTAIFAIASVFYALSLPNIYKASTLLAPAGEQSGAGGLAKMAGQFGGLASLAGVNLGGGGIDKTGLALEVLKSRYFIEKFITKHNLKVSLMAVENWQRETNTLVIDPEIYNENSKEWVREVTYPETSEPSAWGTYEAFSKLLNVSQDKETAMITLSIEYYSPEVAIQWLNWLVDEVNTEIREQDKTEAQNSINFLSSKLEKIQLADMQTVFYQLIEEQTKTIMLAEVTKEYVLKTIDPANAPDAKAKPKRGIIVVLGTILGGMLSVLIVIVRYFSTKSK
jgi:uncharacterized protein involved in exopolysaccharide biosynthesis